MLNWVVVGIGDIAVRRVIPAIQAEPRSGLYGLVTRDLAKAAPFGAAHVWSSLESALGDPDVHCVYIATPVFLHAPQTIAALRAGKHVLCEKPMAMNVAEAQAMVDAAKETGKILGVSYYRRTYPKVARAKQLLDAGAIGKPVLAELTSHGWFDGTGPRSWLIDPAKAGGGPLFDIASHRIDLLNFLFGEPRSVTGQLSNAVHGYAVEDNATVMIEYASGVRGIVDVRWHSKIDRDECRIRGIEGEIELSPLNAPDLVYPGGRENIPRHANLHHPMVENFVDAVWGKAELLSSGESALWTSWVIDEARDRGGTPIPAIPGNKGLSGSIPGRYRTFNSQPIELQQLANCVNRKIPVAKDLFDFERARTTRGRRRLSAAPRKPELPTCTVSTSSLRRGDGGHMCV